jgi:tripartite-type tricarboxylate transporter receptor subunit TctC
MEPRLILLAAVSCCTASMTHAADAWPNRPIRMIVPTAAGGANDVVARLVAQPLAARLGQPIIIDNRGGAGGAIGAEIAAAATPDGYTLLAATFATHSVIPHVQKGTRYDALRDFTPIALFVVQYSMLAAHPSLAAGNVRELVALVKARPGKVFYASAGPGSTSHVAGLMFARQAGIELTVVPYKGGSPAIASLLANESQLNFGPLPATAAHIRAGRLKGIAVSGPARSLSAPEVPTVAESGVPGFSQSSWVGLVAPARTPMPIVEGLHRAVNEALESADLVSQIVRTGAEPAPRSRAAFASFLRDEYERYGRLVRELGITAD